MTENREMKGRGKVLKKTFVIGEEVYKDLEAYVYKERTNGNIYCSKSELVRKALESFLAK